MAKSIEQEIISEYAQKTMGKNHLMNKVVSKIGQTALDKTIYNVGRGGEDPSFYHYFEQDSLNTAGQVINNGKMAAMDTITADENGKVTAGETSELKDGRVTALGDKTLKSDKVSAADGKNVDTDKMKALDAEKGAFNNLKADVIEGTPVLNAHTEAKALSATPSGKVKFSSSGHGKFDMTALSDSMIEALDEKYQYTDPVSEAGRGTDVGRGAQQVYRMGKLVGIGTTGTATAAAMRYALERKYYRDEAETRNIKEILQDQTDRHGNARHFDVALDNTHSDLLNDFRNNEKAVDAYLERFGINSRELTQGDIKKAFQKGFIRGNGGLTLSLDTDPNLKDVLKEKQRQLAFGTEIHNMSRIKGGVRRQLTAWARESAKGTDANSGMMYEKGILEGGKMIATAYRGMAATGIAINTKTAEILVKGGAEAAKGVDAIRLLHSMKFGDEAAQAEAVLRHTKISEKAMAISEKAEIISDKVIAADAQFLKSPKVFVSGHAKNALKHTKAFKAVDKAWQASPVKLKKDLIAAKIKGVKERISLVKNSAVGKAVGKLFAPIAKVINLKNLIQKLLIKGAIYALGGVVGGLIIFMCVIPAVGGIAATTFSFGGNNDIRQEDGNTQYYNTDNITGELALHEMKQEMVKYVTRISETLTNKQLTEWQQNLEDWKDETDEKNIEIADLQARLITLSGLKSSVSGITNDPATNNGVELLKQKVNAYNNGLPDEDKLGKGLDFESPGGITEKATGHGVGFNDAKTRVENDIDTETDKTNEKIAEDNARLEELAKLIDDTKQKIANYEYEVQVEIVDYVGDGVNKKEFVASAPTDADLSEYGEIMLNTDPADKKHYYKLESDYVYLKVSGDDKTLWPNYVYSPNTFYKAIFSIASASYQSDNNAYDSNPGDGVPESNLSYIEYCKKILKEALASSEHKEMDCIASDGTTYMGRVEITVDAGLSNICRNFKNSEWESNPYLEYMQDWVGTEQWGVEYSVDPKTGTLISKTAKEYWGNTDPNSRDYMMFQAAQTSFDFDNATCKKYGVDFLKDDFKYEGMPGAGAGGAGGAGSGPLGDKLPNGSGSSSTPFAALPESQRLSIINQAGLSTSSTLYKAFANYSAGVFYDDAGNEYTWTWDNLFSVFSSTAQKKFIMMYWGLSKVGSAYDQQNRFGENSFDCSSYCYRMYKKMGIDISYGGGTTAAAECEGLVAAGKRVATSSFSGMQPGDLIFTADSAKTNGRYLGVKHVAMYIGNGMIIQATGEAYGVQYKPFKSSAASNIYYVVCRPV